MTTARPGVSAFRGIQAGLQVNATDFPQGFGMKTMASIYLLGTLQLTPQTQFYNPREERNSRVETHRVVPVARHGEMRFESSLQFQRAPHWFSMFYGDPGALVGTGPGFTTPVARSAPTNSGASVVSALVEGTSGTPVVPNGTARAFTGSPPASTDINIPHQVARYKFAPDPDKLLIPTIWTIEYGDNFQFYQMQDSFVRNFNLRIDMNNAVMASLDMFGKFPAKISRTANIPQPLVHDAVSQFTDLYVGDVTSANLAAFYETIAAVTGANPVPEYTIPALKGILANGELDPASGNAALKAMLKDGLANSVNLSIPTGIEMTRYTSGGLEFTDYGQMYRTISMDVTLRHSPDGLDEFDKYVNDAERRRLFRMVIKGPEIQDLTGSTASDLHDDGKVKYNHFIVIDMTALYSDSPQFFTEQGGDDLFTMRASGYHEPSTFWNRDMVAYVQTNRPSLITDATY